MKRLARWLRDLADRIDWEGAPKGVSYSFTIEPGEGIRFRADGRGCPLWYLGEADYLRAHREAGPAPGASEWERPPPRGYKPVREKGGYSPPPRVYDLDNLPNAPTGPLGAPPGNGVRRDNSL